MFIWTFLHFDLLYFHVLVYIFDLSYFTKLQYNGFILNYFFYSIFIYMMFNIFFLYYRQRERESESESEGEREREGAQERFCERIFVYKYIGVTCINAQMWSRHVEVYLKLHVSICMCFLVKSMYLYVYKYMYMRMHVFFLQTYKFP